jgi:hypothetical protein
MSNSRILISSVAKGPSPTTLRLNSCNKHLVVIAVMTEKKTNTFKSSPFED